MSKEAREAEAVKDEALRMKSASLAAVTTENEMLRSSLASARRGERGNGASLVRKRGEGGGGA